MGEILRAVDESGMIRVSFLNSKDIVNTAQGIHNTSPVATAALGRTLTMTAFLGSMLKSPDDKVTVYIKGDGPLSGIVATSDGYGMVKGYVYNPLVDLPLNKQGKLAVGAAIGKGYLSISKDLGLKEPYMGSVPLVTGEIAEDFTYYFAKSEQTPTAIALGVLVDTDLSAKEAGGFIVQLMPNADDETAKIIEQNVRNIPPVTEMLSDGMTGEEIIRKVTEGFKMKFLDSSHYEYRCDCSHEKIEKALISLGRAELTDIIETDGKAELTCQFCPKVYRLDKAELVELLKMAENK
ncbi:MAG: Hsp33 family molecular chaperone HslO [Ruminococcaceae bacterium]|nr:Hsp33 family molecular chaperone HslO [Oscillospiraceae bacterium]